MTIQFIYYHHSVLENTNEDITLAYTPEDAILRRHLLEGVPRTGTETGIADHSSIVMNYRSASGRCTMRWSLQILFRKVRPRRRRATAEKLVKSLWLRSALALGILVLISGTAAAQQSTCTVPVTVVAPALSDRQRLAPQLESNPESGNSHGSGPP